MVRRQRLARRPLATSRGARPERWASEIANQL